MPKQFKITIYENYGISVPNAGTKVILPLSKEMLLSLDKKAKQLNITIKELVEQFNNKKL